MDEGAVVEVDASTDVESDAFGTSLFGTQAASVSSAEMGRCMLFGGTHLRTDIQPPDR